MKKRLKFRKTVNVIAALFVFFICLSIAGIEKISAAENSFDNALAKESEAKKLGRNWSGESYNRSVRLFLEAAQELSQLREYTDSSECLRRAGRMFYLLGDIKNSKLQYFKAIEIDEKARNPAGKAKSEGMLALIFLDEGDNDQSEKFYKKAIESSKNTNDFAALATAHLSEAEYGYYHLDSEATVKLYEETLKLGEQSGDDELLAQILLNLSYAYCKDGNPVAGLKTARSSLKKWKEIGDVRGQAISYTAMGLAYKMLDREQTALTAYNTAESLFPTDIDLIEHARLLTGFSSIYSNYNDFVPAKNFLQRSYDLFRQAEYPMGQLSVLPFLIKFNYLTDNPETAEKYRGEVNLLSQKLKNEIFSAYTSEISGNEKLLKGSTGEALADYSQALKIFQKYKNKKGIALLSQRLGEAFSKSGENLKAIENLNSALQINREIKDKFAEAETLYQLAKVDASSGDDKNSLNSIENSILLTENLNSDILNTKLKTTYFSSVFDRYEIYINRLMKNHREQSAEEFAVRALQASEKSRARSLLETLQLADAAVTKDALPETIANANEIRALLNAKTDNLTNLLGGGGEKSEITKLDGEIDDLQNQLEVIKTDLKQKSPVYSAIKIPAPFDVAEFQHNMLDDNSLLLEFSLGNDESYLWLVGKNEFSSYVLPPREKIEKSVETLRGLLASNETRPNETVEEYQTRIATAEAAYWTEARDLSKRLLGQIGGKISGKRLIIVADGKLHYLPFAALPLPDFTTDEPILLTNETIYEPSAQTLEILAKSRNQYLNAKKNLLIFSDPVFTGDDARFADGNKPVENANAAAQTDKFRFVESLNNLPRLAASKDESETITNIVGASEADNYAGFAATRENLLNVKAENYKILHFATHGLTDEKRPELSGIVLSRFDEKGVKLDEFFRIQDIYGLNLNADLVVLSACETGIGKEVKGEGLISLNNAFLQTGAKSVMASLWKVEDGATLELMKNFYGAMANENLTPSQALRSAQIKLRENPQYSSPFYWAAFTVQGDFQNVPHISDKKFGLTNLLLFALIVPGLYLIRRFWIKNRR